MLVNGEIKNSLVNRASASLLTHLRYGAIQMEFKICTSKLTIWR